MSNGAPSAAPVLSLRGQLPGIEPALAGLLNSVLDPRRELWLDGHPLRLDAAARRARGVATRLRCARGELALIVEDEAPFPTPGERSWSDYEDTATRTLAWTLAHEALLVLLGRLFGTEAPMPDAMPMASDDTAAGALPAIALEFHYVTTDVPWRGRLWLSPPLLEALAGHAGWARAAGPVAGLLHPSRLRICMPGPSIRLGEWRQLSAGDWLIAGPRAVQWRKLRVVAADGRCWRVAHEPRGLVLLGNASDVASTLHPPPSRLDARGLDPTEENAPMQTDPTDRQDAGIDGATSSAPTVADALQWPALILSFELGELSMTLEALDALRPGSVITLAAPLDDAEVTVRSSGRAIARGRLVAVGETLAVQLSAVAGQD